MLRADDATEIAAVLNPGCESTYWNLSDIRESDLGGNRRSLHDSGVTRHLQASTPGACGSSCVPITDDNKL